MIAHTSVGIADYDKSKQLYTAMLGKLGYTLDMDLAEYHAGGFSHSGKRDFWIGQTDKLGGVHVAFAAASADEVKAFYDAALAAGATDNGAPGYRTQYSAGYYAAFIHDFDGNNIEAVWTDPTK